MQHRWCPLAAAVALYLCLSPVISQQDVASFETGETTVEEWVSNPTALHVACPVEPNVPTVCTLEGSEDGEEELTFYVMSLPEAGMLYETSQNFRQDGVDPKHLPDPIGPHMLPMRISDPMNRVVYIPPPNMWAPEGHWASLQFYVTAMIAPEKGQPPVLVTSMPAMAVLTNPQGAVAGSSWDITGDNDGWTTSGNFADVGISTGGLKHQALNWGSLSHYVLGVDEVQYLDFATGFDRTRWYFEASKKAFCKPELVGAYGGRVRFKVRSLYGNFSVLNSPLDFVTFECDSCDSGRGLRIVRFVDEDDWSGANVLKWDGSERQIDLKLTPMERWMKDPLNSALEYQHATECEIASTLMNISRFAILGDWTRGGEGIAIDDVAILAAPPAEQPAYPVTCQKGCQCRHNTALRRPTCC